MERPEFPRTGQHKEIPKETPNHDLDALKEKTKQSFKQKRMGFLENLKRSLSQKDRNKLPKFPGQSANDIQDKPDNNIDRLGDNLF